MRRKVGAKRRTRSAVGKKRGTHRRRRRIGGLSGGFNIGSTLITAGGVAAGAFAAVEVDNVITKNFTTISQNMSGLIQIGIGIFLPKFVKKDFVKDIGYGMIANGALTLMQQNGLISGVNDRMTYRINGGMPTRLNSIAGGRFPNVANANNLRFIAGGAGNNWNDPPTGRPGAIQGTGSPNRISRTRLKTSY